jgi:hypothetical protein
VDSPQTLAVGNGVIGFNADATGLQSLNTTYSVFPLTTLSDWGWHSSPLPEANPQLFESYPYKYFNISTGRSVPYPLGGYSSSKDSNKPNYAWLRENPHRLDLIQVALRRRDATFAPLVPADLNTKSGRQELDLWKGELSSNFSFGAASTPVATHTVCHMDLDILSWSVAS